MQDQSKAFNLIILWKRKILHVIQWNFVVYKKTTKNKKTHNLYLKTKNDIICMQYCKTLKTVAFLKYATLP